MKKQEKLPIEMNLPLESLRTIDIYFKSVLLPKTETEPSKLMLGFKFEPRDRISMEARKKIEAMIRNGEHLRNFTDFVCGKVNNDYTLSNFVKILGWSCAQFSKTLLKTTIYETQQVELARFFKSYETAFKRGWFSALK